MKLSMNDFKELDSTMDECDGIGDELIDKITGFDYNWFTHPRMKILNFMNNKCNDYRSRDVRILFLDDVPTLFFQHVGRDEYRNIKVINKKQLKELKLLIMESFLKENPCELEEITMDNPIELDLYGADICYIENNKLYSEYNKDVR